MREIPLTKGKIALVDDDDYEWLMAEGPWYYHSKGYATNGNDVLMHRLVLGLTAGDGKQADHINRNKLDNRRCNLRLCDNSQNHANTGLRRDNTSGYTGVCFNRHVKKYQAAIQVNGLSIYLGVFADPIDAAMAHDKAARRLFGEFAVTNFEL
jgi:hypothetical protein